MPFFVVIIALLCASSAARADIYHFVNEDGVECFTDAPRSPAAALYQRAPEGRSSRTGQPRPARDRAATDGSEARRLPAGAAADADKKYTQPLAGTVTSLVGMRVDPFDGVLRHHDGVDIAAPAGSEVRAVAPGTVIFSGPRHGYGNTVIVEHDDGTQTLYAHNSANLARQGERVEAATVVALCGSTGRSTGPHLHFEAWRQGENITHQLIDGWQGLHAATRPPSLPVEDRIRRVVQPDGTLFFTNLP